MLVSKVVVSAILRMLVILLRRLVHAIDGSVISMSLHMLLQILRTFEGLATELAPMWLQRHMDSNVRSDVVAFDHLNMAVAPCTLQVKIIGTLAPNVFIADMFLAKR